MEHACKMRLPELRVLVLKHASITAEGAYWLAQGSWPLLDYLNLSCNQLDATAMRYLSTGTWPQLQSLKLARNPFSLQGLKHLINSAWPFLSSLEVGLHALNGHDSIVLLGLDADSVQEQRLAVCKHAHLCRTFPQHGVSLWPHLTEVLVALQL